MNREYNDAIDAIYDSVFDELESGEHIDDISIPPEAIESALTAWKGKTNRDTLMMQYEALSEHSMGDEVFPALMRYMREHTAESAIALASIMEKGAIEYASGWLVKQPINKRYSQHCHSKRIDELSARNCRCD